jgi:hypothetical protein
MMDNLKVWNSVREVPQTAMKAIMGGRLKGMSDINPVWRMKTLTEQFGMCGFGWKYEIVDERLEKGCNDEVSAFVKINLFVNVDGVWSDAIPGTGGSSFIAKEKNGMYQSDECFKMALTDAISVSCKALGFGADVYWSADRTKYSKPTEQAQQDPNLITEAQAKRLFAVGSGNTKLVKEVCLKYGYTSSKDIKKSDYDKIVEEITKEAQSA